jgi:DNA-binding HxlR family transcriptional regulator
MALLDFLGRRCTLRIGWELGVGPLPFRELQRRTGISSPNLVSRRLKEGVALGIFERDDSGDYCLSEAGRELGTILRPLDAWAKAWHASRSGS